MKEVFTELNIEDQFNIIKLINYAKKFQDGMQKLLTGHINEINDIVEDLQIEHQDEAIKVLLRRITTGDKTIQIKKCLNCELYFIATNGNHLYCNTPINSNTTKTCNDVGPANIFNRKMENDRPLREYRKAYSKNRMRVKNKNITLGAYNTWRKKAKEKLEEVRTGKLDEALFINWLKE